MNHSGMPAVGERGEPRIGNPRFQAPRQQATVAAQALSGARKAPVKCPCCEHGIFGAGWRFMCDYCWGKNQRLMTCPHEVGRNRAAPGIKLRDKLTADWHGVTYD